MLRTDEDISLSDDMLDALYKAQPNSPVDENTVSTNIVFDNKGSLSIIGRDANGDKTYTFTPKDIPVDDDTENRNFSESMTDIDESIKVKKYLFNAIIILLFLLFVTTITITILLKVR